MFSQLEPYERGLNKQDIIDNNDPSNFVWSVVIDTQGMKKTPAKGYRYGGLVKAKREFFARRMTMMDHALLIIQFHGVMADYARHQVL
jgi:hypothetical protein